MNRDRCPLGSKCPAEQFLHETAQAIISRPKRAHVETAWLIEWPAHGAGGPTWWRGRGFTSDSNEAIRFSRKQDAENCLHSDAMGRLPVIVTEHQWIGPVSEPASA
ncbi:MAG: hypothetical protein JWM33_3313 [Caulobacteraceae bacterium]|nr:hypothetical protein [Caulobacteraceae bacterium]